MVDQSTGITKQDLFEYYALVAPLMVPHLKARPVSLVRTPAGIAGELFFQKHAQAASIPGIKLLAPELDPGHAPMLEIPSAAPSLQASQFNVTEFHTWNATATARAIRKPDRMCFDLDPDTGVGWTEVQEVAQLVRTMLDEMSLASFMKTSGGKELRIVVPLTRSHDFDTVKDFSHAMESHLARALPQRLVEKSGPKNRIGKIFVDCISNGFGATTVSAWSALAPPGMGVSVPVIWDELDVLTGGAHWTVQTLASRLSMGHPPWGNYEPSSRGLTTAMKTLGFKPLKCPFKTWLESTVRNPVPT